MGFIRLVTVIGFMSLWSLSSYAQAPKFAPKGISGYVGAGFANFTVKNPPQQFKLDQGVYMNLGGERGFGFMNLYLTFGFGYLSTKGQTYYDYTTLSGNIYQAADVNFKSDIFQTGLGLKLKLIDGYWFKPYVEGGGNFGYYTIKYEFSSTQKTQLALAGSNYKKEDSIIDFGHYMEAGAEIAFSNSFALRAAARLIRSETKEVETLNKQKINYESEIYYLGLMKSF
ncbi:MAG: outer membrane beta-barrel protein [Bdellovibrionales bacterium]